MHCLTARGYNESHSGMILITDGLKYRYLTNNEAELAMTLPIDYTDGETDENRARCIGNGWTVDVIANNFKGLKNKSDNIIIFNDMKNNTNFNKKHRIKI